MPILRNFNILLIIIVLFSSCTSKKDILYLQGLNLSDDYTKAYEIYKIQVDDVLKIDISSENPEVLLSIISNENISSNGNLDTMVFDGYLVDSEGMIYFPSLGGIKVSGLTLIETRNLLYRELQDKIDLINPSVDIKLLNTHFTIIGEVNQPGRYEYFQNNLNILEAIGIAGDLNIQADRKNLILLRDRNGIKKNSSIDLTKASILNSSSFQIQSGDIIIVNPNSARVKNAGLIGNSGTLVSLLSFLLTSIILITR